MSKIIEWIKEQDDLLMATIILFIVGILVGFLGAVITAVTSSHAFGVFGGLVVFMGIVLVIIGFWALISFLLNL